MANIHTPIPELKLNDGTSIPMLGFGSGTRWFKKEDDGKTDRALIDSMKLAIGMGYTHLDGAEIYHTEKELGAAIKESGVDRSKLYVTTKVFMGVEDIPKAIDTSLEKLQLDHVDLYLVHVPFLAKSDEELQQTWAAMEQVKASGKAKSIGVSNFLPQHFKVLEKTQKIVPSINQIEFHPYLQHSDLLDYHKSHGIATAAYGPLTAVTKAKPGPTDDFFDALARKYAVSPGEISLRWCIDQDIVAVTTSSKEQRMSDMLRVATFKLTPAEITTLKELGEKKHFRGFFLDKYEENDRS